MKIEIGLSPGIRSKFGVVVIALTSVFLHLCSEAASLMVDGTAFSVSGISFDAVGTGAAAVKVQGGLGVLTASDLTLSATGDGASGYNVSGGAQALVKGGSILINGMGSYGYGISVSGAQTQFTGSNLTIVASNGTGFENGVSINTGGAVKLYNSSISVTAKINGYGVNVSNADTNFFGDGLSITTSGSFGYGVALQSDAKVQLNNSSISTTGSKAWSAGIYFNTVGNNGAASFSGSNLIINTTGSKSQGIYMSDGGGFATIVDSSITTNGYGAYALCADSPSSNLATTGTIVASGLKIAVQGNAAAGVYSSDMGRFISIASSTITTNGVNGYGLQAQKGAVIQGADLTISTTSNFSYGLYSTGAKTLITGTNLIVGTTGNSAHGAYATNTGSISLNGASVTTSGNAVHALYVDSQAVILFTGGTLTTNGTASYGANVVSNGSLTLDNATIRTTSTTFQSGSPLSAYGIYAASGGTVSFGNNTSINTAAVNAYAILANGASTVVTGSNFNITTTGQSGNGVAASNKARVFLESGTIAVTGIQGNVIGLNQDIYGTAGSGTAYFYGNNLTLTAAGYQTNGVNVATGTVILNNSSVTTTGSVGTGIIAYGQTSSITGSHLTITTNMVSSAGIESSGGGTGPGATVKINNTNVLTNGANSNGIDANGNAILYFSDGTVSTMGNTAHAVYTYNTSTIALTRANLATSSNTADAVYANNGGLITLADVVASTTGALSIGLLTNGTDSSTGTGSKIVVTNSITLNTAGLGANAVQANARTSIDLGAGSTIVTGGGSAYGLYANGVSSLISGTAFTVTTSGNNAHGFVLSASSSDIKTYDNSTRIATTGSASHAISVQGGAVKTYDGNAGNVLPTITVSGQNSAVLDATGAGSMLTLKNTALNAAMTTGSNTWGAKAENGGGKIVFADNSATGGTGIWSANGGTIAFTTTGSGNGSRAKIDAGGALDISQSTNGVTIGSLEGAGFVSLGGKTLTIGGYTTAADSASTLFSGTINGAGSLIKQGTGILTLSGTSAFAYTGSTSILDGVLAIRNINTPATFTKTITLNGGWLDLSDAAGFANPPEDGNNPNNWSNLTIASGVNAANGGVIGANDNLTYNIASGATTIGYMIGSSTVNVEGADKRGIYVVKTGNGTLTLTGTNQYYGNTRVEGGILKVSQDVNLGDTGAAREVVLGNQTNAATSGTLEVAGSFNTNRNIELRQNGSVVVDPGVTTTWGNITTDLNNAAHALTKLGTGTMAISGSTALSQLYVKAGLINTGTSTTINSNGAHAVTVTTGTAVVGGGTIATTGNSLVNIYATGGNSGFSGTNLKITANGASSSGISSQSGAIVTLNGVTDLNMSGNGAVGANAAGGYFYINGGTITMAGSSAVAMQSNGSYGQADGVSIKTTGAYSYGLYTWAGGRLTLNNSSLTTTGLGSTALYLWGGFTVVSATNTTVATVGDGALGVYQCNASTLNLFNTIITTTGSGALGILANNSDLTPANVIYENINKSSVTTIGADATALYVGGTLGAYGSYWGQGYATIKAADSTFNTSGVRSHGVVADNSTYATITVQSSTITTSGSAANGAYSIGTGTMSLANTDITTSGAQANALAVRQGGKISVTGGTIKTSATNASGIFANSGTVTLDGVAANVAGDLVTATGTALSNVNTITLKNIQNATNGGNVLTVTGTNTTTFVADNSILNGDMIANKDANVNVTLRNNTKLTGAADPFNMFVDPTSTWALTGSSSLTTLTNDGHVDLVSAAPAISVVRLAVTGSFVQGATGDLVVALDPTAPLSAIVTASSAVLSGTLDVAGFGNSGTASKASQINNYLYNIIATSGTGMISGDFGSVIGLDSTTGVDYIVGTHGVDVTRQYYQAQGGLAWFAGTSLGHGNFTIDAGKAFEIDINLNNQTGTFASGWDGKSLTKLGGGLLILSGSNGSPMTYTGTTTVTSGTLRLSATNIIQNSSDVVVNGALDTATANYAQRLNNLSGTDANALITMGTNTITLANTADHTYAGTVSGSGILVKTGPYAETISGNVTAAHVQVLNGGTLTFAGGGTLSSNDTQNGIYAAAASVFSGSNITVKTGGTTAKGVYADQSSTIALKNTAIDSAGDGVRGQNFSTITLADSMVIARGENANYTTPVGSGYAGLGASGASGIIANNVTINTTGSWGYGLLANSGAAGNTFAPYILGNNLIITTTGSGAAGAFLYGSHAFISATNSSILTKGDLAYGAYGFYASQFQAISSTIATQGNNAFGVAAEGGATARLYNTTVSTLGNNSAGLSARSLPTTVSPSTGNIWSWTAAYTIEGNNLNLTTKGDNAAGARADNLSDSRGYASGHSLATIGFSGSNTIATTGSNSAGLLVTGSSVISDDAQSGIASIAINTQGANSAGIVIDGQSSDVKTSGSTTITTTGNAAHGIVAQNGATKTYDATAGNVLPNITVNGGDSAVLNATGSASQLTLKNTALNAGMTLGASTWGAKAENNGGTIIFADNSASGGTGLWSATGGTITFINTGSGNGSRTKVDAGGALDITQSTTGVTIGSLEGAGLVSLGANTLTIGGYTTAADSANTLFSGTINGAGSLIKQGVGVITLSGTDAFAYTGSTSIKDGVIAIRNIGTSSAFTKTITLDGGWLDLSDATGFANPPKDGNNPNTWDNLTLASGTNAANGGVIGANDKLTYDIASGTTTIAYMIGSSTINVEGADKRGIYVVKTGNGTLTLTGSNQYMGNTRVEGGILQVTKDANLGDTTVAREVVLGNQTDATTSGTLQISGNFNSKRSLELRQNGTVLVDSGITTTWANINADLANVAHVLTKNGAGTFIVGGTTTLSGLTVNGGMIDTGLSTIINATAVNTPAIIMNNGTASIGGGIVRNTSGDLIVAASGSASELRLNNLSATATTGNLASIKNGSTLTLTTNKTTLTGDIIADAASSGTLNLRAASQLTGMINAGKLSTNIDSGNTWNMTATSVVGALANNGRINIAAPANADVANNYKTLTMTSLTSSGGVISMNTQLGDDNSPTDRLIINGDVNGATTLRINNTNGIGAATVAKGIEIVQVGGKNNNGDATFQLGNRVEAGAFKYDLFLDPDNNWYLRNAGLAPLVDPVVSTAAAAGLDWFMDMDNLHKRMGDLRLTASGDVPVIDNTWIRFSGQRMNAQLGISGFNPFTQYDYGVDVGVDHAWNKPDNNNNGETPANTYYTGVFVGATDSDRNFGAGYNGSAKGAHIGAYATWMHRDGWYADLVGKVNFGRQKITGTTLDQIRYNTNAQGLSLELGRTLKRSDGWWVEPSIQVATVWNGSGNYTASDREANQSDHIDISNARMTEFRELVRMGRQYRDTNWFPYAKIGVTRMVTTGGKVTFADQTFDANLDGWNVVFGLGTQYMISKHTQVYLDYEYDKSAHFERPWVINLGWRKMW